MKKTIFAFLILSSNTLFAQARHNNDQNQSDNVPQPVRQSFQNDAPGASNATWEQNKNRWHANYKDKNNRNIDTYYDPSGNRVETHTRLDKGEVPVNVDTKINTRYNVDGNYDAERIERPNYQPLYKVRYHHKNKERIIYLDEKGKKRHYHD